MMYICLILLSFALFATCGCTFNYFHNIVYGENSDVVFTVKDLPYNRTFDYWVANYFKWFLSLPNIENGSNDTLSHPRDHYSPEKCSWNQNKIGPVWMLADGKDQNDLSQAEIRDCEVPAGKALLVQIVGSNCSTVEGYTNDKQLMDCAVWILPSAYFSASLDGKEIMNTNKDPSDRDRFYVKPFLTNLTYAPNNYYGYSPGVYRGTEAGYFIFMKPLLVGNHVLKFEESVISCLDVPCNDKRISNVQYNIAVKNTK